jgi:predicted extracellular nuclease
MRHLALAATLVAGTVIGSASTAAADDPATDGLVISEIHYDNAGADVGEFVEVAGPAGTDLTGWSIVLYNGSGGSSYGPTDPIDLSGTIDDEDGTRGALDFATPGLQNGGPDGLALVDPDGVVVEFLSYEGEFIAANGPAAGTMSTDIGVSEPSSTPVGESLQLIDGVWTGPAANSRGILNSQPPPPPPEPTSCDIPSEELDLISEAQGVGDNGSLAGTEVTVRGVVTLADPDLNGFFVQEEPADEDVNPATSEGIFVFDFRSLPAEGQTVTLTDVVSERFGQTQLSVPDIDICDVPPVTIEPTPLDLPLDDDAREAYEGMLVTNGQDLQVTGLFTAYRFGELGLALDGPLPVPTSVFAPGTPAAAALAAENAAKELFVNDRDEAFSQFNPYPWELFDEDLSAGDTMPAGRLVGALAYSFGDFKVEPLDNAVGGDRIFFPETDDTFPRPDAPDLRGGNDVATFNVLNYFNTFGDSAVLRGATNQADFEVQTDKLVDAINRLDASVVGLIEIENDYEDFYDGDPATVPSIVTLVDALNADAEFAKWTYIQPPESILTDEGLGGGGLGPDAIATGLIYQTDRAFPIGSASTFDIDAELSGDVENNRWPIAQKFQIKGNLATVVVNHFKSKGSSCTDTAGPDFAIGDDVRTDETGNCDLTRQYAANRLVEWADSKANNSWAGKVLLVGDFNSYEEEMPIEILVDAGYVDLVQRNGDDAFTYKFDGRYGRLDYVFASPKLAKKASDAEVWQINSPAPVGYLYDNDPIDRTAHGSSDHDPVVVSLK